MNLAELKKEYTDCLITILTPYIYDLFKQTFANVKKTHTTGILKEFQLQIKSIAKWSEDQKNDEFIRLVKQKNGECIADLIKAIFMTHTKILYGDVSTKSRNRINIIIPNTAIFIHLCYVQCARVFYQNPMLFNEEYNNSDYLNKVKCEEIIKESINGIIRQNLPIKDILRKYLDDEYQSEPEDTENEDISNVISNKQMKNLRKLIKNDVDEFNMPDDKLRSIIREELQKIMEANPPKQMVSPQLVEELTTKTVDRITNDGPENANANKEDAPNTNDNLNLEDKTNEAGEIVNLDSSNLFKDNDETEENNESEINYDDDEQFNLNENEDEDDIFMNNTNANDANLDNKNSNNTNTTANNNIKEVIITSTKNSSKNKSPQSPSIDANNEKEEQKNNIANLNVDNTKNTNNTNDTNDTNDMEDIEADNIEDVDLSDMSDMDSDDDINDLKEVDFNTVDEDEQPINNSFEFF